MGEAVLLEHHPGQRCAQSLVAMHLHCGSRARYSMIFKGLFHSRAPRGPRFIRAADSAISRLADVTAYTPAAERSLRFP
jgi:hypothetical protein